MAGYGPPIVDFSQLGQIGSTFWNAYDQGRDRAFQAQSGDIAKDMAAEALRIQRLQAGQQPQAPQPGQPLSAMFPQNRVGDVGGQARRGNVSLTDPVAPNLVPWQKGLLNAIAAPESGGQYNVRYTPKGGTMFADYSQHPGIREDSAHGPSDAAGRYQFISSTWNRLGGGAFTPEMQDQRAIQLATQDYKARTGRDLATDIQQNGLTPQIMQALSPTWLGLKDNPQRALAAWNASMQRYGGGQIGAAPMQPGMTQGPPQAPQAPTQQPPGAGLPAAQYDPAILARAAANPYTRPQAMAIIQQLTAKPQYGFQVAGDTLYATNPSTGAATAVQGVGKPEWKVIGKDAYGNEQYGWVNPQGMQVRPGGAVPGAQPPTGPDGKPLPPNIDPKAFRDEATKRYAGGVLPPKDEEVSALRKEAMDLPSVKTFNNAITSLQSVYKAYGNNSRAADLDFVYAIGKIFDPNSVVREGEMVMAKNTQSLPDIVVGAINALQGNQGLTPEGRKALLDVVTNRVQQYRGAAEQDLGFYGSIATDRRMNPKHVLPPLAAMPTLPGGGGAQPPAPGTQPPGPQPTQPPAPPKAGKPGTGAPSPIYGLRPGEERKGYIYLGGDETNPNSWKKKAP